MQELRRFRPSTVSRRFSLAGGFYKTCVIDGLLEYSPADHVRLPARLPESPTLGFAHLQFDVLLTAARESSNRCDFALVAMLGLLGLRIFEATGADIADLGEEHGHPVLRVCGKGTKVVLILCVPRIPSTALISRIALASSRYPSWPTSGITYLNSVLTPTSRWSLAWLQDRPVMPFPASPARSPPAGAARSCCHPAAMKIKKA